ncbi:hypothetical protein [Salipaludibacillus sp. CF4.18]|uniref:hypothetical protein n=1 Tax=Salipaludibacillus sp. CF4.18 TaxID=3373081 RepID=UPI003EE4ADD4
MAQPALKEEKDITKSQKSKKKFQLPNVLVMMLLIMLFACALTYLIPAGEFETDESGVALPGTYYSIDQTPVNPIDALNLVLVGGIQSSTIVVILLFMGRFFGAIFMLNSIPNVINYLVYRFKKAGANALVLGLFSLMGLIGFFIGGDMMIVFVTLGVILTKQLKLDPITALAVTFLPLFLGFSVGPSGMALIGQMISTDIPLFSGYGMRTIIFLIFIVITAIYVMWYVKRVAKDSSKSFMNNDEWLKELDEDTAESNKTVKKITWQDVAVLLIMIAAPMVLAFGNTVLNWADTLGNGTFVTLFFIAFVLCYLLKRKTMNEMVESFTSNYRKCDFNSG